MYSDGRMIRQNNMSINKGSNLLFVMIYRILAAKLLFSRNKWKDMACHLSSFSCCLHMDSP